MAIDVDAPTTKLDAVNLILWSIGESPVNTIDNTGIKDVELAQTQLDRTTRQVLTRGWDFNSDYEWELTPDASNNILVPSDALRIDPSDKSKRFVERSNGGTRMLWDREDKTWIITEKVEVDIVWGQDFDEVPEAARMYIAVRAARLFQAGAMGSDLIYRFTSDHEAEAKADFRRAHSLTRDANLLRHDPTFRRRWNPVR